MNIVIRAEKPDDKKEIYDVVKAAFEVAEQAGGTEQDLVNRLRESGEYIKELSLVAVMNDLIVGHIMFTKVKINSAEALALAPLAVHPKYFGMGIGSQLILQGHEIAKEMGYIGSIVLGSEKYYPKFGYVEASGFNIQAPFDVPDANFMAIELIKDGFSNVEGIVEYSKCFME